ncbi:MAG TPA: hypothetical protein VKT77_06315 [Chthonomonadaceae bacterium]|nr:hypothetical protein [Chthonomonadaceae bacterium]
MLDQIGKIDGSGWYLPWYVRDPKNPEGPPVPVLLADAQTGEILKRVGGPEVVLHGVNAKLFQKGVHAANVVAATVRADQQADKVYATGGCRVTSLVNPKDTVLTSDRMTWDIAASRIVAQGHAHVERRPKDAGLPFTQDGGTIVYDLEHNTVTVE